MCMLEASRLTGVSECPMVWAMPRHPLQGERQVAVSWITYQAFQVAQVVKNLPALWETRFSPWVGKIPWKRKWQPTPVYLPGKSHGQRSLGGYSPRGHKELDMTEHTNHLPWEKKAQCYSSFLCFFFFRLFVLKKSVLKYGVHKVYCYSLLVLSPTSISHHVPTCNY